MTPDEVHDALALLMAMATVARDALDGGGPVVVVAHRELPRAGRNN